MFHWNAYDDTTKTACDAVRPCFLFALCEFKMTAVCNGPFRIWSIAPNH